MIARAAVVAEARSWKGTKFQHHQSLKGVASDCIGFISGVGRELGLPDAQRFAADTRFQGYSRTPDPVKLLLACEHYLESIPKHLALPGDVLVIRFILQPMHFAFVTGEYADQMIHCYQIRGGVVEHGIDKIWRERIFRAYRIRGVE